mgnify:CR=1 FL=1
MAFFMPKTMVYYVYILQSQVDGRFYIGQTQDLSLRVEKHSKGYSTYTSKFRPWNLVWFTEVDTRKEAMKLEKQIKGWRSRQRIIKLVKENPCVSCSINLQICDLLDL